MGKGLIVLSVIIIRILIIIIKIGRKNKVT